MDERKDFVKEWEKGEEGLAELCRRYSISRVTGYKWVARYQEEGEEGLRERSRAPHAPAWSMSEEVQERLLELRAEHPRWGPRKLRAYLAEQDAATGWPAASSIGALLAREGLVTGRRKRRRTPPFGQPLSHAKECNQVWCADFKGWFRCGNGERCDPLTITDARSRYLLRCRDVAKTDGGHVRAVFEAAFREFGLPGAIRTDNGAPFASPAPGGLSRLSMWWLRLQIRHERIKPGCPQQNGRHERMHATLKQETAMPPQWDRARQQQAFDRFQREYNEIRPHEALQYRTPASRYSPSPRKYPSRLPELEYPPGAMLRRISQQGSLKWKTERTFVSEVLAREYVGLVEVDDGLFEVYYGPLLLGWLDGHEQAFVADHAPTTNRRKRRR